MTLINFDHAANAIFNLAICYENGQGVLKDQNKAIQLQLHQRAADLNHAGAISNLAVFYENGKGAIKDQNKAIQLDQRAADMNHANALLHLIACWKRKLIKYFI